MVSEPRAARTGTALCLSGGGFRAALFHLGAIRRLNELGVLADLRTISGVSGGSIIAAFLAQRMVDLKLTRLAFEDFERDVAIPFRAFTSRDLRTFPLLAHVAWDWLLPSARVNHLARRYHARLTSLKIGELPVSPAFVLCATDMVFGVNWEFRRDRSGDFQMGYTSETCTWPLARAVAASSSFPPVFGPMPISIPTDRFAGGDAPARIRHRLGKHLGLTDGGVYDNMGLEPVWKNHACVLVSDCGAPFPFEIERQPIRRLLRYAGIVTNQTVALRRRLFFAGLSARDYSGTYWHIGTDVPGGPGYSRTLIDDVIERVRTDLDRFTDAEQGVLENHGYAVAADRLARNLPDLGTRVAVVLPHPGLTDEMVVRDRLKDSHKRLSLRRLLGG